MPNMEGGFYIGLHRLRLAQYFPSVFISVNILENRRSGFPCTKWIMDSGAFTQLQRFGKYTDSVEAYCKKINRWALCGTLEMAVTQDYMCEPFMLAKTGLTVAEHQRLTIERYDTLLRLKPAVGILPVLQGYYPEEYVSHIKQYGHRLAEGARVGVGSVCKRNGSPRLVSRVLSAIHSERPDLLLHGFGLKTTALRDPYVVKILHSADSMAWSFSARRRGEDANGLQEAKEFYYLVQETINVARTRRS